MNNNNNKNHFSHDYPPETPSSVTEGSDDDCEDEFDDKMPAESSGYMSSQEENSGSSSDTDGSSSDATDYQEDIDEQIRYLHEKQLILQRAATVLCSEEAYEAATALATAKLARASIPPSAILKEAMSVLPTIDQNPDTFTSTTTGASTSSSRGSSRRPTSRLSGKKRKNLSNNRELPRELSINTSTVSRLSSLSYLQEQLKGNSGCFTTDKIQTRDDQVLELLSSMPPSIFRRGQWMAQALVWSAPLPLQQSHNLAHLVESISSPSSSASSSSTSTIVATPPPAEESTCVHHRDSQPVWKMVSNPLTHTLGLAPPFGTSFMDRAVDIQEAMALSSQPRVLTQATPPFSIVYANRAFLCLAKNDENKRNGVDESVSSSLIGHPIESIIQLALDADPNQNHDQEEQEQQHYLKALFPLKNNQACRIQVFPVIDRSRCPGCIITDDDDDHKPVTTVAAASGHVYASMSHILVQVSQVDDDKEGQKICNEHLVSERRRKGPPQETSEKQQTNEQRPEGHPQETSKKQRTNKLVVVGTIG